MVNRITRKAVPTAVDRGHNRTQRHSLCVGALLDQVLLGLSPFDPLAFGIVAAMLSGAGVLATFIPARRALSVAPVVIPKLDS